MAKKKAKKELSTNSMISLLKEGECFVTFEKTDGTKRKMRCSLNPYYLPIQTDLEEHVQKKKKNDEVCVVFDLDKKDWRSFRWDTVIAFESWNIAKK